MESHWLKTLGVFDNTTLLLIRKMWYFKNTYCRDIVQFYLFPWATNEPTVRTAKVYYGKQGPVEQCSCLKLFVRRHHPFIFLHSLPWIPVIFSVFMEELGLHGHGWKLWKLIVLSNLCICFSFEPVVQCSAQVFWTWLHRLLKQICLPSYLCNI